MSDASTRRHFLVVVAGLVGAMAANPRRALAHGGRVGDTGPHPTPRPNIDASRVTPSERLDPDVREVFDMVREMPQIVDGIRCQCGCAEVPENYSLLSCFEGDEGMGQHCAICQNQARLAHKLFKQHKSLDDIRRAIDSKFG